MVVILFQDGSQQVAERIRTDLNAAFAEHVPVQLIAATSSSQWPADTSWDDLLIVVYADDRFPAHGERFIEEYIRQRQAAAMLLPVSTSGARRPPAAASAIKALPYDGSAPGPTGRLVNRVGGMLGLRLQGRDTRIFISYRTRDGSAIANQLHDYLQSSGHHVFLDEARELDGETAILPGSPVQAEIDEALGRASLVLLLDTPSAPESLWIRHEVDTADGLLLPILPICFRNGDDPRHGPRFLSLLALQRWVELRMPSTDAQQPLSEDQLALIVVEAEKYLCEIFRRKCRVPFLVEREFVSHGFAWKVLDRRLLMFESSKNHSTRLQTRVSSHCSLFDQVYTPAFKRFCDFLKGTGRGNYSLFIYDGEILPERDLVELAGNGDEDVVILHHQELAALLDSNFTILGTS